MIMDILGSELIWEILKHTKSWLSNLGRASKLRKEQSVKALRGVIKASRETAVYIRQLQETGKQNHDTELHLALSWTDLAFELQDIGITKLAKRCQIKGKHWANPSQYDEDFLQKADVSLDRMEKMANEILLKT
jgi:hypothetical protein